MANEDTKAALLEAFEALDDKAKTALAKSLAGGAERGPVDWEHDLVEWGRRKARYRMELPGRLAWWMYSDYTGLWSPQKEMGFYREAKRIVRHDKPDASQSLIDGVVKAARDGLATRGERPLDRQDDDSNTYFDDLPRLLCVRNGVLNLRDASFTEHQPGYLMTRSCTVAYDADATCAVWLAHIHRLFDGNEETIAFFRRVLAQSLIGRLKDKEPIFLWLYGKSGTGKTTALEVIVDLLGSYAKTQGASTFTKKWQHTSALEMYGTRVALVDDADSADVDELKRITGSDIRHGQPGMGQDFREYVQSATLMFTSNYPLNHDGRIEGLDRRYRPIKCTDVPAGRNELVTVIKSRTPEQLAAALTGARTRAPYWELLKAEQPGILKWLVDDCATYYREGIEVPEHLEDLRVQLLTVDGDEGGDALTDWTDNIEAAPGDVFVNRKALRTSYLTFNVNNGSHITDKSAFKYLREVIGCKSDDGKRKVTVQGAEGPKRVTERGFWMARMPNG